MIKIALFDIEGTTTKISFVHDVLFPYARENLNTYVRANCKNEDIALALDDTRLMVEAEGGQAYAMDEQIQTLLKWIDEDRKAPPLKTIQGYIWKDGYEKGNFRSHVYEDVIPTFRTLKKNSVKLGIYSSGSVKAQKLLFGHTPDGDINPLFDYYFDTKVGSKKESSSYTQICSIISKNVPISPSEIIFLSDVKEELDAAKSAGMHTLHVVRPGTSQQKDHPAIETFKEIEVHLNSL